VDAAGNPVNDRKHVYAQAFSIYGLSAYYQVTQDSNALHLAKRLFELIDQHTYDPQFGGNIECRARDWSHLEDMRLSSIDLNSSKSMVGHMLGAAAAIEAIVCVKTIETGTIHPTVNLDNPDPLCDLDYTPHQAIQLEVEAALSNSLGFGGHNAALVIKRYR